MRGRMPLNNMKEAEGVSTFFVTTKGRVRLKKVMNTLSLSPSPMVGTYNQIEALFIW